MMGDGASDFFLMVGETHYLGAEGSATRLGESVCNRMRTFCLSRHKKKETPFESSCLFWRALYPPIYS